MDWNHRQRELEERLRSLRVRDEDVLKKVEKVEQKMNMILEKLQNQGRMEQQMEEILKRQDQMERKIEILTEEIFQKDVKRANETTEIMDVVGTNLGWLEYFSEESDKFEKKMAEMKGRVQEISQTQLKMKNEHLELVGKLENGVLVSKTEEIMSKVEEIGGKVQQISEKQEHLELVSKTESGDLASKTEEILSHTSDIKELIFKPAFNCSNPNCYFSASKIELLREDGVTVECPECKRMEIVGKLKEKHRWMFTHSCVHFQQFPIEKQPGTKEKCQICGKMTQIQDAALNCLYCKSGFHGIPREDGCFECSKCRKFNLVGKLKPDHRWMRTEFCKHYQQFFVNIKEGDVQQCQICGRSNRVVEFGFKCWNSECNTVLDKDLPLREDGVSVNCSKCNNLNIIGTLTEGKKWMLNDCCYHFLQVPLDKKYGEKGKCPYCGKNGELWGGNGYVSLPY